MKNLVEILLTSGSFPNNCGRFVYKTQMGDSGTSRKRVVLVESFVRGSSAANYTAIVGDLLVLQETCRSYSFGDLLNDVETFVN